MDESTTSTTLGRYLLLRKIGQGGMGEVWLAEDPRLQRQVALKVLPARKQDDQEFLVRFEREARAAAALHHPHILPVHDYGQQQMPDGQTSTYLVMSYVSGGSLAEKLEALAHGQGNLTQEEALTLLSQCAEAIDYAHASGIIHRDIKPANMLLGENNWLHLTDFGIARILTDENSSTQTGTFLGSPTYMAPEQAQGHAVPASDIYSLAVVAYQFFTGRVPFQADNPYAMSFQHAFSPPPAPRSLNPALSSEFEIALLRGLAKDPTQRPRSATAYVTGLRQALALHPSTTPENSISVQAPPQTDPPLPVARRHTRRNILLGVGAGVLLAGGGTAAYLLSPLGHAGTKPGATLQIRVSATTSNANAHLIISTVFTQPVTFMSWSPAKNNLLAIAGNGHALLWNLPASSTTVPVQVSNQTIGYGTSGMPQGWSPDGNILALGNVATTNNLTPDTTIFYETLLYKADLASPLANIDPASFLTRMLVQGLGWISNRLLVTVSGKQDESFDKGVLTVWDIQQPQQSPFSTTFNHALPNDYTPSFNALAVSPKDAAIAIGTSDGVLTGQLDTNQSPMSWQQADKLLTVNQNEVDQVAWSANGQYLSAVNSLGSGGRGVGVWDATKNYQPVLPALNSGAMPDGDIVTHIVWSPKSATPLLALGGIGGKVYLWNPGTVATPSRVLAGTIEAKITALCWSSDGLWLAASYDDAAATILIWRM